MGNLIGVILWVRQFLKKMKRDRVDAYSAQSAFYVIMSFIPFIMMVLTLLQYTPLTQEDLMSLFRSVFPEGVMDIIRGLVESLFTKSTALVSGTAIAAIWASSRAVLAITNGLNSIHNVDETRNYFLMRLRSALYIIAMMISLILAMGLLVFGNQLHSFIVEHLSFLKHVSGFLISARTVVTLLLLTILFTGMYTMLPNEHPRFFTQIPGAAAAAVSWSIFSYGFSIYLTYAHNMSAIYGSLTTAVIVMLWLYFCMWLLFLGAEINCYMEKPETFHLTEKRNMIE